MAKVEGTYTLQGVTDDQGQTGTLTVTVVKGGPDKMQFEPDAAAAPEAPPEQPAETPAETPGSEQDVSAEQLPASSEKVDEIEDADEQLQAGQLPAQPPEGGDEEPPQPTQQPA